MCGVIPLRILRGSIEKKSELRQDKVEVTLLANKLELTGFNDEHFSKQTMASP